MYNRPLMVEHRWSGAWCLDCGIDDPSENCVALHDLWDKIGNATGWIIDYSPEQTAIQFKLKSEHYIEHPECEPTSCSEPNSHNHDPYWNNQ